MTIKQQGGIFGRNPTFNDVEATDLTVNGVVDATSATTTLGTNTVIQTADSGVGPSSAANELMVENADNAGITIATPDFKAGAIFFGKPTGAAMGRVQYNHDGSGGYMRFFTNNSEAARFTAAGHLDMTNGHDGNIILASGSGIDFSATSGTGTSELFDDYEEGTWTPTLIGATSGSMSFAVTALNRYTKVGRVVHAVAFLSNGDMGAHTISGNVLVSGLPFTATAVGAGVVSVTYCNLTTADEADITISGYANGTNIHLLKGSSITALTNADLVASGTNGAIMLDITYETEA